MSNTALIPPFILLEDCTAEPTNIRATRLYHKPLKVIEAYTTNDLEKAFKDLELERQAGHYLAGFLAYEALSYFEPTVQSYELPPTSPLLWFLVVEEPIFTKKDHYRDHSPTDNPEKLTVMKNASLKRNYENVFHKVKGYIQSGDSYQINFTYPIDMSFSGKPLNLFNRLKEIQAVPYAAMIDTSDQQILSLSPELFFECRGEKITTKPMKGTAPRGADKQSDEKSRTTLQEDAKNRAENLMIVDLLRNDLSKVAKRGTVEVETLFDIEAYETLHQMTSTISATLKEDISIKDIFKALFPCGSVTGAPKVRSMEIIHELESVPRGAYCGAIGYIEPTGDCCFNVPIRTMTLAMGEAHINVGGGIVDDSDVDSEWAETRLKAQFLTSINPSYALIETLLWTADRSFHRLEEHLNRLKNSAEQFLRPYDEGQIRLALETAVADKKQAQRVRLTLDHFGDVSCRSQDWTALDKEMKVTLVPSPYDKHDPLLMHKTTRRVEYDTVREDTKVSHGVDEVFFFHTDGTVSEGSYSNIFIKNEGRFITPPLKDGCLPGVMRSEILSRQEYDSEERSLTVDDLKAADQIYLTNSLRGLVKVSLI